MKRAWLKNITQGYDLNPCELHIIPLKINNFTYENSGLQKNIRQLVLIIFIMLIVVSRIVCYLDNLTVLLNIGKGEADGNRI